MSTAFSYTLLAQRGAARRGRVATRHGTIETPAFMPVGTQGTVKGMLPESVRDTGAQILLGNTYHLMLRPGAERVERLGGLHRFMQWPGPILTDSGGFQVMSLAKLRRIDEEGVTFQSHLDGSAHLLTPERAIDIQHRLGSDITMALDECTPHPATREQAEHSMRLSMRWALRSKAAFRPRDGYGLFGIVQGGMWDELRRESAEKLLAIGFDGYAVGGLAVGEGHEEMFRVLDATLPRLPPEKPRYLMGVGLPSDIIGAVARGVDMFDCVIPTRAGRFGRAYVGAFSGPDADLTLNLKNAVHADDPTPVEPGCDCPCCAQYSRAYLHHLFKAEEMLGPILLTWHNIQHYQRLMEALRERISPA